MKNVMNCKGTRYLSNPIVFISLIAKCRPSYQVVFCLW